MSPLRRAVSLLRRRPQAPRDPTIDDIKRFALNPANRQVFAAALAEILPEYTRWTWGQPGLYRDYFDLWQRAGFNLTPNHYYSPLPDMSSLSDEALAKPFGLIGIDMREEAQLALLERLGAGFGAAYGGGGAVEDPAREGRFFFGNGAFERVDAEILYAMVRHFKPRRVIEIGSGYSTLITARACTANAAEGRPCRFVAIEPHPSDLFKHPIQGLSELRAIRLEEASLAEFEALAEGDILFIDSSHVVKRGNDVETAFFDIIPRLGPGVVVHLHDIFLPAPYPPEWLRREHVFWNEQYVLAAFLMHNSEYEVLWAACFMHMRHPDEVARAVPGYRPDRCLPGSFWMQRRP